MSIDENKLLVRRFIEEIINTGNVDAIENFIAPDYTEVHEGKKHVIGIQGAKEHILGVRQTYPDLTLTVEQQIAEGDWVRPWHSQRFLARHETDGESRCLYRRQHQ